MPRAASCRSSGTWTSRPDSISEPVYYKQILGYGVIVTLVGPLLVWAALVLLLAGLALVSPRDSASARS